MVRVFLCVVALFCVACQVDDSDNYSSYHPAPEVDRSYYEHLQGTWCKPHKCIHIEKDWEFFCETDSDCDTGMIVELQQKYFRLDKKVCGIGPVVAFQFLPPYDAINLFADGMFQTFYKR